MAARQHARHRTPPQRRAVAQPDRFFDRLLAPIDGLSQAIYSILILLTFTLAFRIFKLQSGAGVQLENEQVRELLLAAIGAAMAWGIIDGLMYVLTSVFERNEKRRLLRAVQGAATDEEGIDAIAAEFDFTLEPITTEGKRRALYTDMMEHLRESRPQQAGLKREDLAGGLGTVLVALVAVLPSLAPFALIPFDAYLALRVSNVVSFVVLFICGWRWGRRTQTNPLATGLTLMLAGAAMVLIAIPLGG
jgi:VIT1/CCC1 family predicted Fe2+/Mn2+ transporter